MFKFKLARKREKAQVIDSVQPSKPTKKRAPARSKMSEPVKRGRKPVKRTAKTLSLIEQKIFNRTKEFTADQIAQELRVEYAVAYYHLKKMQQAKLIKSQGKVGRNIVFKTTYKKPKKVVDKKK